MEFFDFADMPVDTSWPTGMKKLFAEDEEELFPPERIRFAEDIDVQDVIRNTVIYGTFHDAS